jgi:ligand-binding sensor domain-containing protein
MRLKISLLVLLTFIIYGCGITSRETAAETSPKNSIKIYALTDKGIALSNSNGAKWDLTIQKTKTNNLPSTVINEVLLANNNAYLATDRGLAVSTDNMRSFEVYLEKTKVNSVQLNGLTVLAATDAGCYISTGNNIYDLIGDKTACQKAVSLGKKIYASQKNMIYVCTENIYEWHEFYSYPAALKDFFVLDDVVIAITGAGLYLNGQLLKNFEYGSCRALYVDAGRGLIWLSTDKGLYKSADRGKSWVIFDRTSGLEETNINAIFADNLNIYLASDNGLWHSVNAGETWKTYRRNNGLVSNKILKVFAKK